MKNHIENGVEILRDAVLVLNSFNKGNHGMVLPLNAECVLQVAKIMQLNEAANNSFDSSELEKTLEIVASEMAAISKELTELNKIKSKK